MSERAEYKNNNMGITSHIVFPSRVPKKVRSF